MSLLFSNELRVMLCKDQVQLVQVGRQLTSKGIVYRVLEKKSVECMGNSDSQWDNAVLALEGALSEINPKPSHAQVILSNHFMRYTMVPWNDSLNNEAEEIVYAKHCFSQLYGISADSWELRINQAYAGAPQFVSAVDSELIQNLRKLFSAAKITLKSVQPHLMTAFNNCHAHLKNHDAWMVLFEQGNLCLGLVQKGHWRSVRSIKVKDDWLAKLPDILDRESALTELNINSDEVFLWAPDHWNDPLPKNTKWKIQKLQPTVKPDFAPDFDARFAIAMCC